MLPHKQATSSLNIIMIAWMIFEFSYMFGLKISKLMLAENIVIILYIRSDQYIQRRYCRNFQEFGNDHAICQLKTMFMLIEDIKNLGPL